MLVGLISIGLPTLVIAQNQTRYDPACQEYEGTEPPPEGMSGHDAACDLSFGFGAMIGTAAEMVPFAAGLALGALARSVVGRVRRRDVGAVARLGQGWDEAT